MVSKTCVSFVPHNRETQKYSNINVYICCVSFVPHSRETQKYRNKHK
nr:MAG TPA: hypothetical protein [Caudoviricetes sp.]